MNEPRLHRALFWGATVPAVLLFVPLVLPVLMGRMFAHMDLAVFHLPLRYFYSEQLTQGKQFLWSSNLFHGFYVHAEGQFGGFHPLHLLLYRFLPLVLAFNIEVTISYPFAFAGMWLFLRNLGLAGASRTVGAISFAFSGFFLLRLGHPNGVAIAAHIPWLLLSMNLALSDHRKSRARGLAAIAALTGSQVLLGYPQYVWISGLACAAYAAMRWREPAWLGRTCLMVVAGVAGVFIGGVQLLPTLDLLEHSNRAITGQGFRLTYSLHPLNLVQLWAPYALPSRVHAGTDQLFVHEFGLYSGALGTLALVWLVIRRQRVPVPRVAAYAAALCVTGLVLALGRYGVIYEWLSTLPVLGAFRAPARHILLIHLGLALLTAITYEDLIRSNREDLPPRSLRRWLNLPAALAATTAVAGLIWWSLTSPSARPVGYPAALLTGVGFILIVTTVLRDAARGVKTALVILPTLVALDLGVWGYSYVFASPLLTLEQVVALADRPPMAQGPLSVHDATVSASINYLLLADARILQPYVGLQPRRILSPNSEGALRVAGVGWVRSPAGWNRVANPAQRARIVPTVQVSRDARSDVDVIDIMHVALVEQDVPGPLVGPEEVSAVLSIDEPGRLELEIDAPGRALLALTESFHSGWKADGGGRPLTTLPLYGDYLGVLLEPGQYRLVLTFEPRSIRYGWYFTIVGLLGASLLTIVAARQRPLD